MKTARRLRSLSVRSALITVLAAGPANAQFPPSPTKVPLSSLSGLDPAGVRARLAGFSAKWPARPAFQVDTPEGLLTFIRLDDLMMDAVGAERMAAFRTRGDSLPSGPYLLCTETLTRSGAGPEPGALTMLMFRNGRFETAFSPVFPSLPPPPNTLDRKAWTAQLRRPVTSPFIAHGGDLPLEDGLGFLSRWTKVALSPSDELGAVCGFASPSALQPSAQPHGGHRSLSASDMQSLALLPFAITLPAKNRQRVEARKRGAALLASLRVGQVLEAKPERFASDHPGVRFYPAKTADYGVLTIDLGGYPGRNLANFNDAALVGVRSGRIEWISPPASLGPSGDLLCLDENGVPNTPRRGCSGWGHFSP